MQCPDAALHRWLAASCNRVRLAALCAARLCLQLILPTKQYAAVQRQLRRDLELLERLHVIDYSLLLGVHFQRWGNASWHPPFSDWPPAPGDAGCGGGGGSGSDDAGSSAPASPLAPLAAAAGGGAPAAAALTAAAEGVGGLLGAAAPAGPEAAGAAAAVEEEGGGSQAQRQGAGIPMHRCGTIAAADALAELIESLQVEAQQVEASPAAGLEQPGQPAAQLPPSLRQAAASLVQTANISRVQARLSATEAVRAAGGCAAPAADAAACPPGPQLLASAMAAPDAVAGAGPSSAAAPAARAAAPTQPAPQLPPVAGGSAAADGAGGTRLSDWRLDRSCGLGSAVCLGGARCLPASACSGQSEHWAPRPPPPVQGQHSGAQSNLAPSAQQQQCVLLRSGDSFSSSGSRDELGPSPQFLGSRASTAATAVIKQQQVQLDRLLSRRDSAGVHVSVGRGVPAVAVRQSSSGEVQCEPVVLYFGIIDFLQVCGWVGLFVVQRQCGPG